MNRIHHALPTAARLLLGGIFVLFGLNGFLDFLPAPPLPDAPAAFVGALAASGYLFPLLKGTEILAGALLLANRFVPLALTLLAPIIINIAAFHIFLAPSVGMVVTLLALEIFLAWSYRQAFAPILAAKHVPQQHDGEQPSHHRAALASS